MTAVKTRTTFVVMGALLCLTAARGAGPSEPRKGADELPPLNRKVAEYARGRLGEKVGNGECTTLASAALRSAGAKLYSFRGTGGDYVWGRPVESFGEALPGDVVQFRDAVFKGKSPLPGRRTLSWRYEYPHHTAVISEVRDRGKTVLLLHQNIGPEGAPVEQKQIVTQTTLRADSLQKGGRVWIYRPVDPDDDVEERPDPP
jgi:hypothetical protein